ncbi:MAG TPA: hypothetical protein VGN26_14640 [Armatimonadota bacterium]
MTVDLQRIDRRVIYLLLLFVVGVPLLVKITLPISRFPDSAGIYDTIQTLPTNKPVIVLGNWGGSTMGENGPQSMAILYHLLKRGIPVMITGVDQQGPGLVEAMARELAPKLGRVYGKDFVNFGYRPLSSVTLSSLIKNIPDYMKKDAHNTPVAKIPLLRNVKTLGDCSMVIDISGLQGTTEDWVGVGQSAYHMKMASCVTAVGAPQYYPLYDSGQLVGILVGMRGAAEYEALVGRPGQATRLMPAQSGAHVLVVVLIVLCNLAYMQQRKTKGGATR